MVQQSEFYYHGFSIVRERSPVMSLVTALAVAILATSAQGIIPFLKSDLRGLRRLRLF